MEVQVPQNEPIPNPTIKDIRGFLVFVVQNFPKKTRDSTKMGFFMEGMIGHQPNFQNMIEL
jgi:hypothetical protein